MPPENKFPVSGFRFPVGREPAEPRVFQEDQGDHAIGFFRSPDHRITRCPDALITPASDVKMINVLPVIG
jgi:hypothetical protein